MGDRTGIYFKRALDTKDTVLFKSGKVKTYNVWPKVALFTHFLPFSPKHQLHIRIYIRIPIPYLLIYGLLIT